MSSYRAKAIILKTYKLGEADKIIKLYSQKNGLIDAVAKGARKIKSKFGGRLELFNFIDLELASGKSLDIITNAEILRNFSNIPLDFNKFIFCQLISEIVLKMHLHTNEASPVLFKLIYVCFNEIDNLSKDDIYSIEKVTCFFIAKFLKITGYAPIIENCIRCGTTIAGEKSGKISFSIKMGGVLCPVCSKSAENMPDMKKDLSLPHYILISDLFSRRFKDFRGIEFDRIVLEDVYKLISSYFNYHTDCHIDCCNYLNKFAAGVSGSIKNNPN
ncbi:MAG: DNA repair protein RecO [Actinobacteria bacterium]|nr:DNA repair protein RecO [Actinomycetota bacterium]